MKTRFLKIQLTFVMLLLSMKLMADAVYPIVLNPQLLPPYSNCLLDYAASKRFNVYVLNRDMNHSSYSFILSIKMKQGNSYLIDDKVKAVQFTVSSGIPTIVDITPLLNHVKDIKNNGFRYEEGAYEFVFQAFDATNPQIAVSEPAYLMAYLSQSEPPVCIYPNDNDCITPVTGGMINFSWIESVAAVPDPSRKFKFEIYEMPDNLFNDSMDYSTRQRKARMNSLVNTQVPIFSDETNVPFYSFVNTTGRLQKNHTYLWRVQIFKDGTNPNGQYTTSGYYKNNGWSEPFTLRYRNCNPWSEPVVVQQEKRSDEEAPKLYVDVKDQVTISWETNPEKFCGYRVGYNVKGQDSIIEWTTQTFSQNESSWVISKNITPGVDYVARIEGITDCRDTTYTNPKKTDFSMRKKVNNDCISNISEISLNDNIEEIKEGDIIDACGKSVRVTSVTRNNDGSFKGEGVALLPILSDLTGIKVSFENIKVNSAKELTSGNIVSIKGKNTLTLNVNGLVNKQNAGNKTNLQETIAQTKSSSSPNASSISLSDNKVSVSNIPVGSIVDNNELAGVDDNTKVGENGNITFSAKENGNPVFDNGKEPFNGLQIDDYYKISGQWIALETGKSAKLVAKLTKGDSINLDSVSIYIQAEKDAVKIENIKWSATKECEFTIFAGNETEHLNLIAVDKSKGSYNVLGRAFIQSMKHEDITLHLVPVRRDPSTIEKDAISKYLNAVYNPLGKYFTIVVEEQFDKEEELEFLNDGLDVTETSLLSTESEDMKLLLQAYTEEHTIKDSNEAYIFICPSANDINVKGDMPRNKSVGYVFSSASTFGTGTDPWTIAHEIGHGIFDLEHTFDFGVQRGTTTNLMDYAQKTDTKVWQWSVMDNHPSYTLPFLEDAEDSQWTTDGHYYLFTYLGLLLGLDYNTAEMYGRWSEEPDTHIDSTKIANDSLLAEENITWLIGGLQQQNHALTGGYHGVELAATLYALMKAKNDPNYIVYDKNNSYTRPVDPDCKKFLFHRFGDCFAHAKIDESVVPNPIVINNEKYIKELDNYLRSIYFRDSTLARHFISIDDSRKFFITSYDEEDFIKYVVGSLIQASDFYVGYEYDDIKQVYKPISGYEFVKKGMKAKLSNKIDLCEMYGGKGFTLGHAPTSKLCEWTNGYLGSNPDAIVARPKLFKYYTRSAIDLLCEVAGANSSSNTEFAYKSIEAIVDWAVSYFKSNKEKYFVRLDGILAFLIEVEKMKNKKPGTNQIVVKVPIKKLIAEADDIPIRKIIATDSDEELKNAANKQVKHLKTFLKNYNKVMTKYKFESVDDKEDYFEIKINILK